jgi:hypothetical protein
MVKSDVAGGGERSGAAARGGGVQGGVGKGSGLQNKHFK